MAKGFNKPAICVDVHVHRISNRLGIVKTKTPDETEMELRKIFNVTLDELCNNLVERKQNNEILETPICNVSFEFTEDKVNEIFKTLQRTPRVLFIISLNLIFLGLMILNKEIVDVLLFGSIIANIIFIRRCSCRWYYVSIINIINNRRWFRTTRKGVNEHHD